MHIAPLFAEHRLPELLRFMRSYPLATLVGAAGGKAQVHLLPLEIIGGDGPVLVRGHVSRTHTLLNDVRDGQEVLALFQSPNAYISPRWYIAGQRSRRVAPSWNFAAVEGRGPLRLVDDPAWVRQHLAGLTDAQEATRAQPFRLEDAAPDFIESAASQLIGFEIPLSQVVAKVFLSQQRTAEDRASLKAHLAQEPTGAARDVGDLIAP